MKVFNKNEVYDVMQYTGEKGNDAELVEFADYNNSHPLYNGGQLVIKIRNIQSGREFMYANISDWVIKQNGNVMTVISNRVFKEEYVEI